MGAATATEWRRVRRELKAVVRSTLAAARAEVQRAATVEWTVQDGEVRKPVTGRARTGEANAEPSVLATAVTEADGVSEGDVAEGGEPSETARRTRQAVGWRSGAADRLDVQRVPRRSWCAMIVITDTLTGVTAVAVTGAVQDIAVMVGSVVKMNGVTGNDDDAKLAPTTRRRTA